MASSHARRGASLPAQPADALTAGHGGADLTQADDGQRLAFQKRATEIGVPDGLPLRFLRPAVTLHQALGQTGHRADAALQVEPSQRIRHG